MKRAKKLELLFDKASKNTHPSSDFRSHLGLSILGEECTRKIWYAFQWVKIRERSGRMQRLLQRGKDEETRISDLFLKANIELLTHDEDYEQFTVSAVYGHVGGSMDGVAHNVPDSKEPYCVVEEKTHNQKSFDDLKKKGVEKSKYQHYMQGMGYAYLSELKQVLYIAVNKNNDEIYTEIYNVKKALVRSLLKRADFIVFAEQPPQRISDKPTFYKCKMCEFADVCFGREAPHINCRTCAHSTPTKNEDALWVCEHPDADAAAVDVKQGCALHLFNPYMLAESEYVEGNKEENWVKIKLPLPANAKNPKRRVIKHGPDHIDSAALQRIYWRLNKDKLTLADK